MKINVTRYVSLASFDESNHRVQASIFLFI